MDTAELENLSRWYVDEYGPLNRWYRELISPVQRNANESSKVPLESHLDSLVDYLNGMTFDHLSLQQLAVLADLKVDQYIGPRGAKFVVQTIRTSDYDPATATTKLVEALNVIERSNIAFTQYLSALDTIGIRIHEPAEQQGRIIIRVGFQQDASINNVTDLKDSAKDWYDIIRGLAMVADEAPEDTKIIGAATGSIILILAGTAGITSLLALISRHVVTAATQVVGLQNQIEDLRHKKWLNRTIENELKKQIEGTKTNALGTIVETIKTRISNLDGEKLAALESSIRKLLSFNERGGNLDFVAPDVSDDESTHGHDANEEELDPLSDVKGLIREYQSAREHLKLLTYDAE